MQTVVQPAPPWTVMKGKKFKPKRSQLGREISFDLSLTKFYLMMGIISHSLITIVPIPVNTVQLKKTSHRHSVFPNLSSAQGQTIFVVASALNCFDAGFMPVIHSLALSLMELRTMDVKSSDVDVKKIRTGELFGSLAVLQAIGRTILAVSIYTGFLSKNIDFICH